MNGSITIPGSPAELPERDPNCSLCKHGWFSGHLHTDGSGRIFSRDSHTIYILNTVDGVVTCTCPNGAHTEPGREPKCWHAATYKQLKEERRLLTKMLTEPGTRLTLESIFPD